MKQIAVFVNIFLLGFGNQILAQIAPNCPDCYGNTLKKTNQRYALPYYPIREADVKWSKRIWEKIPLEKNKNVVFQQPENEFIRVIFDILSKNPNKNLAYLDEEFTQPLNYNNLITILNINNTSTLSSCTYKIQANKINTHFDVNSICSFRIKQEWIFDARYGQMFPRILGIAPIQKIVDSEQNLRGEQALFWIYYPAIRNMLINYDAYSPSTDNYLQLHLITWNTIFEQRLFSSHVIKESNVKDQRIADYTSGFDALLESERIKKSIFEKEQFMWAY